MRNIVKTDGRGRVLLPPELREAAGVGPGALLDVELQEDGSVVLRGAAFRRDALRQARGSFWHKGMSSDELIVEREREARQDGGRLGGSA